MELLVSLTEDAVVVVDGVRVWLLCRNPRGLVCHPSVVGAKSSKLKHQRAISLWEDHGLDASLCLHSCARALAQGWRHPSVVCWHSRIQCSLADKMGFPRMFSFSELICPRGKMTTYSLAYGGRQRVCCWRGVRDETVDWLARFTAGWMDGGAKRMDVVG